VGYFIMPVRTREEGLDKDVDDYVVWSTVEDQPVMRGTRQDIRDFWREEFGRQGLSSFNMGPNRFAEADKYGSDSGIGNGHWDDDDLRVNVGAEAGILPRARLREFCDLYFDPAELDIDEHEAVAERLIALLEPFDWEDAETAGDGS
jgi:hypothetical protein